MGEGLSSYNPDTDNSQGQIFDDQGRQVSVTFKIGESGKVVTNFEYEGDSPKPSKSVSTDETGRVMVIREFKYDEIGNETSVIETDRDGKLLISHRKTYDRQGNLSSDDVTYGNKPHEIHHFIYERDGENTIVREEIEENRG